ncbi:MAG: chemotaxis protein CheW [Vicinamibacteria bacterium]
MAERRKKRTKPARRPVPAPADSGPPPDTWVTREESLFFPSDVARRGDASRISLPSSGLAEDILASAEAASLAESKEAPQSSDMQIVESLPAAPAPETASRVHNISFFAAPAREDKKIVEAQEHLVTFFLAREEYGIDVRLVQEIIRVAEITPVPRAPAAIKGVINLRGRIIPVIDLKRRLGLGEVEASRLARVVVVKLKDRLVGLLVDGASQVLKIPLSTIEAAPEEVVEIDANYIRGVAKLEKRLIILVDLVKILGVDLREATTLASAGPA